MLLNHLYLQFLLFFYKNLEVPRIELGLSDSESDVRAFTLYLRSYQEDSELAISSSSSAVLVSSLKS